MTTPVHWGAAAATMLLFAGAAGCAASAVQLARTNGRGVKQFSLEASVVKLGHAHTEWNHFGFAPNFSSRIGITDHYDFGFRIGAIGGLELQNKVMLTHGADLDDVAVSVAPSFLTSVLSPLSAWTGGHLELRLPVLVGIPIRRDELVLGAQTRWVDTLFDPACFAFGWGSSSCNDFPSRDLEGLYAGSSLGYAIRTSKKLRIMPEVGLEIPIVGPQPQFDRNAPNISITIGFLNGGP